MNLKLRPEQKEAISKMKNGCILCGDVGTGKTFTSLAYYYGKYEGKKDLYVITTAKTRDSGSWQETMDVFGMCPDDEHVIVESWNKLPRYENAKGAFFIFDEQRLVGDGAWVSAFLNIAKHNEWIILSATPGDVWKDYIPVFLANGFYENKTDFYEQHVIWNRYTDYPNIKGYFNTKKLKALRNYILVPMESTKIAEKHYEDMYVEYNRIMYKDAMTNRWNPYTNEPIERAAGLCYVLRRIVNSDESRIALVEYLVKLKHRAIIFYNYDYELDLLLHADFGPSCEVAQWNGHVHQELPNGPNWVYLVNYMAGAEGWNCTSCNTIIFYSESYSYKTMHQAAGRIDRMDTPFKDLYYYTIKSHSKIDLAISRAIAEKKEFNESGFAKKCLTAKK